MNRDIKNRIIFITTLLVSAFSGFSQNEDSFSNLISQTNAFILAYDELDPLETEVFIAISQTLLPPKEIQYIYSHPDEFESNYVDSISEFDLILSYQDLILNNIDKIRHHSEFNPRTIKNFLVTNSNLSIVMSDDFKLINFSLDEKSGGTYHSRISVMHFTDVVIYNFLHPEEQIENQRVYSVLESDGFYGIHTIKTNTQIKYVLLAYVRGCSYCFETSIQLVSFNDGTFNQDFYYSINSRMWDETLVYNPNTKTIFINYFTDDLTPECNCSIDEEYMEDHNYFAASKADTISQACQCKYVFDGETFLTKD